MEEDLKNNVTYKMAKTVADRDPAFPIVISSPGNTHMAVISGLSKREYFAVMAMQGIASYSWVAAGNSAGIAHYAVKMADTLIAELAKSQASTQTSSPDSPDKESQTL